MGVSSFPFFSKYVSANFRSLLTLGKEQAGALEMHAYDLGLRAMVECSKSTSWRRQPQVSVYISLFSHFTTINPFIAGIYQTRVC